MGTAKVEVRPDDVSKGANDPGKPFRVSDIWREVPRAVWLVVLLHVLVMLCQTAVFPNIRAPDELRHFDMIVSVEKGNAWPWPDPGTLRLNRGSAAAGFVPSDRLRKRLALADRQIPPRSSRESFDERGGDTPSESGKGLRQSHNNMVQHPPLYYLGEAALLAAMGNWEDDPLDRILLLLRWSNVFLLASLPFLLYGTACRLGLPEPMPLTASLFPLLVPELTRSGGSVNNDNLLILAGALLALLLTRVLTGDSSRRTALWIGAVTTVALLTKGLALVLPAWVAATYAVALYRTRRLSVVWSALLAGALTCVGLAWWVKNKLVYGVMQPDGLRTETLRLPVRFFWQDWGHEYVGRYVERMVTTFFVQDQAGTRFHDATWWLARVVLLLLVVGILATLVLGTLRRMDALVLIVPTVLLAGLVAKGSWAAFSVFGVYTALQGRYLFAAATAVAVVSVSALAHLPDRLRRPVPFLLLGLGAVIHLANTAKSLSLFWAPTGTSIRTWDGLRESLATLVELYAMPPVVLLILVTGVTLVFLVTAVELLRSQRPATPVAPAGFEAGVS